MKRTDDLYALIKSLSKNEKGYFKKFAARHGKNERNKVISLFDIIEKQKEYNEAEIKLWLKKEKFSTRLDAAKSYLYEQVLRSMDIYQQSIHSRLMRMLTHVEILYQKGLHSQCAKLLSKAKNHALEAELYYYVIDILDWEIKLALRQGNNANIGNRLSEMFENEQNIIDSYMNEHIYRRILQRVLVMQWQERVLRGEKEMSKYRELIDEPLLKNEKGTLSNTAKHHMLSANIILSYMKGDYEGLVNYQRKITALQELPFFTKNNKQNPEKYILELLNQITTFKVIKKHKDVHLVLGKLFKFLEGYKETKKFRKYFRTAQLEELRSLVESDNFEKAKPLVANAEKNVEEFKAELLHLDLYELYITISLYYLGIKEYKRSLEWLNKITLSKDAGKTMGAKYSYTLILNLILHYELKNDSLLEYLARSLYRFFLRSQKLNPFENAIVNFIRVRLPKANSPQKLQSQFRELYKQLIAIEKNPFEHDVHQPIIKWLQEKAGRK